MIVYIIVNRDGHVMDVFSSYPLADQFCKKMDSQYGIKYYIDGRTIRGPRDT